AISGQQLSRLAPSKEILRIALLKCVKGRILQSGCSQAGKLSIGKKVPANKNCGRVKILAKGGMVLSDLDRPLTIKPQPIKTIKAIKLSTMISKNVIQPCTRVNLKNTTPMMIITIAASS